MSMRYTTAGFVGRERTRRISFSWAARNARLVEASGREKRSLDEESTRMMSGVVEAVEAVEVVEAVEAVVKVLEAVDVVVEVVEVVDELMEAVELGGRT